MQTRIQINYEARKHPFVWEEMGLCVLQQGLGRIC